MEKLTRCLVAFGALAILASIPAEAAPVAQTFVSGTGSDGNPCTRALPCRTVAQGTVSLVPGGEVTILDAGSYGNMTGIIGSFSITNEGSGEARIALGTWQPPASAVINLRGLTIDPVDPNLGNSGPALVFVGSAGELHITNCVIRNSQGTNQYGLTFAPTGNARLFIADTLITNNGSTAQSGGILIRPTGTGSANVVLDHVRIENNVFGIAVDGNGVTGGNGIHVEIRNSVIAHNFSDGIIATRAVSGGAPTVVLVEHSASVHNAGAGVRADGAAVVQISNSTMEYNATGASATNGGRLFTYGNNVIDNNAGEDLSAAALLRSLK